MSGLILYTTEDGASRIQSRADGQTVWLTQLGMAELFPTTKQNVSPHLKNFFEEDLIEDSVVKESVTTAADGERHLTAAELVSGHDATVKEFMTDRSRRRRRATTEESSVVQGGHDIPEEVIRRRFDAGLRNFGTVYKAEVDDWALYNNAGDEPVLLDWSEKP